MPIGPTDGKPINTASEIQAAKDIEGIDQGFIVEVDLTGLVRDSALEKANKKNGISLLHPQVGAKRKGPFVDYFKEVSAKRLPNGGDVNIAATRMFKAMGRGNFKAMRGKAQSYIPPAKRHKS